MRQYQFEIVAILVIRTQFGTLIETIRKIGRYTNTITGLCDKSTRTTSL